MSAITRALLPAVFVVVLCGVVTSSALATEAPYYKAGGARLKAGATKEVRLKGEGNQNFRSTGLAITTTCTTLATQKGATINGSEPGEPGTSAAVIEYSGCTVVGNGERCVVTSVAGAKDKKIVTNALTDELVFGAEVPVKGTKMLGLFKPTTGAVIVEINFEPESGGACKFTKMSFEGFVALEVLNAKKAAVAFEENESEQEVGFIRPLANGTKACKIKAGKLDKCVSSTFKVFGSASILEGTSEVALTGKDAGTSFGVFAK
jgi:hypothetical protein